MELAPNAFSAGLDAMAESMVHAALAGPKMPMACELEALVDEYVFGAAKLWHTGGAREPLALALTFGLGEAVRRVYVKRAKLRVDSPYRSQRKCYARAPYEGDFPMSAASAIEYANVFSGLLRRLAPMPGYPYADLGDALWGETIADVRERCADFAEAFRNHYAGFAGATTHRLARDIQTARRNQDAGAENAPPSAPPAAPDKAGRRRVTAPVFGPSAAPAIDNPAFNFLNSMLGGGAGLPQPSPVSGMVVRTGNIHTSTDWSTMHFGDTSLLGHVAPDLPPVALGLGLGGQSASA